MQAARRQPSQPLETIGVQDNRPADVPGYILEGEFLHDIIPARFAVSLGDNLNVGFAHRPRRMRTGIRLSKMIVTSSHSESGCHEDSIILRRQVCQLDFLGFVVF
jgi:hypothetical protein